MKDFKAWINESVLPNIQTAIDVLRDRKDQKDLVSRIQKADPYQDKRFAPVIAGWVLKLDITPEEHKDDVKQFKELHRRLKDLRVPATNKERTEKVKDLLAKKPHDFMAHYSMLQDWNREVSSILDPEKDLSDEGLPVEMRHNGYTMYRIDTEEQCQVPLIKNSMSWCITKASFGGYDGPPYYPIVRDHDKSPFAMIIPAYFDKNPDEAVRNAQNTGRLSPTDLRLIRPLAQHVLSLEKHKEPYIKGVHGLKPQLPEDPAAEQAFFIMKDYAMEAGEWPEGEQAVSQNPEYAYQYAAEVIKGPWPAGERAITLHPSWSYLYAKFVIKGPFRAGEPAIATDAYYAYMYAKEVLETPFSPGEEAISKNPRWAYRYAIYVLDKGRFPAGEHAIGQDPEYAYFYARDVIKGPWPAGEPAISRNSEYAHEYAREVSKRLPPRKTTP